MEIDVGGFTMDGPLRCKTPGAGDPWAAHCTAKIADAGRAPGEVDIDFFDRDQDFDAVKATLKAGMDRPSDTVTFSNNSSYTIDDKRVGRSGSSHVPAWCYQTIGDTKNYAICVAMLRPRILVYGIVSPSPSSESGQRDIDHAAGLAGLATAIVYKLL
jgi:hypothetical protein